ncbi:MAG: pilus assembly PilX N-terminal domain-containing protein [bacterium]
MKRGSALLLTIYIISTLSFLTVFLVRIVYNNNYSSQAFVQKEQAFFMAEAGLEYGKVKLAGNPNWYTDLPYYKANDKSWLINKAVGEKVALEKGWAKVVKEKDTGQLYSIGFFKKAVSVVKIKGLIWEEL